MSTRLSITVLLTLASACFCSDEPTFRGAGSTFVAPLMERWISAYTHEHPSTTIRYDVVGSGAGITAITEKSVAFAASDAPLSDKQLAAVPGLMHLPLIAGPEAIIYHLPAVSAHLVLDGPTLAGIFSGTIVAWNDPKIAATNPGVALPANDIIVVHRTDGSGTTWIFTDYLSKVSPAWASSIGEGHMVRWPVGIGGRGNAGVAGAVANAIGTIGYVELAYAKTVHLPYAKLVNHDGKTVEATIANVNAAIQHSPDMPADMRLSITDAPGEASYPICGFTYVLLYQDLSYLNHEDQARTLLQFISWCAHQGQELAEPDYARVSPAVQSRIDHVIAGIVMNGKPVDSGSKN